MVGAADPGRARPVGRPARPGARPRSAGRARGGARSSCRGTASSTSSSANPASTASRASGPPEGARQRREDALERRGVGLLGRQAEVRAREPACDGSTRANASSAGGAAGRRPARRRPSRRRRRCRRRRSGGPCRPTVPAHDDHAHGAGAVHAVGRRRVQREADVGVAALFDQHDAAVGAGGAGRGHAVLDHLLGRDHASWSARMLSVPTPRGR